MNEGMTLRADFKAEQVWPVDYSFSIKPVLWGLMNSWKAFSASCWLWKCFPCKRCGDAWRSGSWLARSQGNVAGEANLCSPVRSTFGVSVVRCAVRRCRGDNSDVTFTGSPSMSLKHPLEGYLPSFYISYVLKIIYHYLLLVIWGRSPCLFRCSH